MASMVTGRSLSAKPPPGMLTNSNVVRRQTRGKESLLLFKSERP
jgi:hypothetical protein